MRRLSVYEARCAAWWLHHGGLTKRAASALVGRHESWFQKAVDGKHVEANRASSRAWKEANREFDRKRNSRYHYHRQTPYYKALKAAGVDLRTLPRTRST